jgi:putative tricarboxylic transport membrane protein
MLVALILGVIIYLFRKLDYPAIPALMGPILGPMAEAYLRRAMFISGGSPMIFFTRPGSIIFLLLSVLFIYFLIFRQKGKYSNLD